MTPGVVDLLEQIDVEEDHRKTTAAALRRGDRLAEPIVEERAVRQARERIVERQLMEIGLVPCGGFPAAFLRTGHREKQDDQQQARAERRPSR